MVGFPHSSDTRACGSPCVYFNLVFIIHLTIFAMRAVLFSLRVHALYIRSKIVLWLVTLVGLVAFAVNAVRPSLTVVPRHAHSINTDV